MIEIFYNVEGIDQQLKEEYKMADVETKKEFLEKLKQNTIRCLDNKEHDKFTQNIDFMCRVYYQGDENEKSAVESHVKQILKNIAPIDAWACIYILRLMGREMKAEETIKSLLKRLIHDNVGTSAERKELIDALFKEMHEEMRTYFDGEIESICYLVASGSMKTMQNEKRKTELLMKRKHKHIDLLQYAYSMGDSETVEIIVQGFHDIWKMTYDNIESYIDENNYTAMVDIYGVIDEFPADIFSEDEKAIIAGIIEREKQLPILYPRIVTMLKCIFFNEWITEPSDEELEMAEILSGDGNEDIR